MQNIIVKRYSGDTGWQGWVEPEDGSWIIFVRDDGAVFMFDERDPDTGSVLS